MYHTNLIPCGTKLKLLSIALRLQIQIISGLESSKILFMLKSDRQINMAGIGDKYLKDALKQGHHLGRNRYQLIALFIVEIYRAIYVVSWWLYLGCWEVSWLMASQLWNSVFFYWLLMTIIKLIRSITEAIQAISYGWHLFLIISGYVLWKINQVVKRKECTYSKCVHNLTWDWELACFLLQISFYSY